jgi:hypothetical protein
MRSSHAWPSSQTWRQRPISMYVSSARTLERTVQIKAYFRGVARVLGRERLFRHLGSEFVAALFWATPMSNNFNQMNQPIPDTGRALLCHGGANAVQVSSRTRQTAVPPEGGAVFEMLLGVGDRLHFVFIIGTRREKGGWWWAHSRRAWSAAGIGR